MKMITRTITVYTYTTGSIDFSTMKVQNVQNHSFPYKLGQRAKRDLERKAGYPVMAETTGTALYGMSIDDFVKYAHPIADSDAETGVAEVEDD